MLSSTYSALFFSAVTYAGIKLCEVGEKQKSATMRIPMNYIYLCIPICGIISLFYTFKVIPIII